MKGKQRLQTSLIKLPYFFLGRPTISVTREGAFKVADFYQQLLLWKNGCFGQALTSRIPNGSQFSLTWEEVLFLQHFYLVTVYENSISLLLLKSIITEKGPDGQVLSIDQVWELGRKRTNFVKSYIAYHYFRTMGWIVRCGIKFGCDFGNILKLLLC